MYIDWSARDRHSGYGVRSKLPNVSKHHHGAHVADRAVNPPSVPEVISAPPAIQNSPVQPSVVDSATAPRPPADDSAIPALFSTSDSSGAKLKGHVDHGGLRKFRNAKANLVAAILVLIIVALLAAFAFLLRRRRRQKRNAANGQPQNLRAEPVMVEGVNPNGRQGFRVRTGMREEMQRPDPVRLQSASSAHRHRHEVLQRPNLNANTKERVSSSLANRRQERLSPFVMSAAKERYYGIRSGSKLSRPSGNRS